MQDLKHLFPYEKLNKGTRIIIYGAGEIGQSYLCQMLMTGYCDVIAMADRNYDKYPPMRIPVISPLELNNLEFDKVVVALRTEIATKEVKRILSEQGVREEDVVCIYERNDIEIFDTNPQIRGNNFNRSCADGISIAVLISGGLGDNIIQKRFIKELIRYAPKVLIDIYSIRNTGYLEWLYSDMPEIKYVIEDLGSRYNTHRLKYTASMVIEACRYVRIDSLDEDMLSGSYPELVRRLKRLRAESEKERITLTTPVAVPNMIRLYNGQNAYSCFNYQGAFNIRDKFVTIPISKDGERFYETSGLRCYYTVNYGTGECSDPTKVAKMWYKERFERIIALLKSRYPDMEAVQLGDKKAITLTGADRTFFGETMDCVAAILKHAIFHLDTESGTVHLASQIGTKCFVLFGPSVEAFYGYEENETIMAGDCHGCYGLLPDVNCCVRHMEHPACMDLITVGMVYDRIIAYLDPIRKDI